jgi:uncharacterized membrane protein
LSVLGLLGLVAATLGLAILVLPVWSFLRVYRLTTEVARLRARVEQLERGAWPASRSDAPATAQEVASPRQPQPVSPVGHPVQVQAPWTASESVAAAAVSLSDDLESRVGGRWLLYAGVAILLVGVSFLLKYAFDNDWISPATRVLLGGVAGLGLVAGGWRVARHLESFGLALTGVGVVTLYLAIYAALAHYSLIVPWTAFGLMLGTTLLATSLADRGQSQLLAIIAAAGGFLTPFAVTGTSHDSVLLLAYYLLLAIGAMVLSTRHEWNALAATSYLLTLGALGAWAAANYSDDQWIVVLFFLTAFCAVFLGMLRTIARRGSTRTEIVAALLLTAPLLYHFAALVITSDHPPAFHVYVILFTAAGLLLTTSSHRGWLRLLILLAAYLPFFGFVQYAADSSLTTNLVTAVALAILHGVATLDRVLRQEKQLGLPDLLVLHMSMIGLFGLLSQILAPVAPEWRGGAGAILALVAAGLWFSLARRDAVTALNAAGLSFTLLALAIAVHFDGRVAVIGWAAQGATAAWIGLKASSRAFRVGGLVLLALAASRLAEGYFDPGGAESAVANARSLATLVLVVLAYVLARAWRGDGSQVVAASVVPVGLEIAASVFTMMWLSAEITAYWKARPRTMQAALTEELMRSLAWGAYGTALIVVGMWRSLASIRWIGIGVIGITVLKVFFVDLSTLGGIYRVIGFLVLGVLLVMVSYLYQRTRGAADRRTENVPGDRGVVDRRAPGEDGVAQ